MNHALEFLCQFLAKPTAKYESDFRTKSLYIARLVVRKGGFIHSRIDLHNRRQLLEQWSDGSRIWVHPNATQMLQDHSDLLRKNFRLGPDDFEYLHIDERMP